MQILVKYQSTLRAFIASYMLRVQFLLIEVNVVHRDTNF